jgi:glutamyl endopeptidase
LNVPTSPSGKGKGKPRRSPQSRSDEQKSKGGAAARSAGGQRDEGWQGGPPNISVSSPKISAAEKAQEVANAADAGVTATGPDEPLLNAWHASYSNDLTISLLKNPTPAVEAALEVVFFPDDRVQITNTDDEPWRFICSLAITAQNGGGWVGTGWMVSPRLVLTAGHVVFLFEDSGGPGAWAQQIEVCPRRNGDYKPYSFVSTNFRSVTGWTQNKDSRYDYGAILLSESYPWFFGYESDADATLQQATVNVYGYPADKTPGTLWGHQRKLMQVMPQQLKYHISTFGGQSGCPVFLTQGTDNSGVGIHTSGDQTGNFATRINDEVFDQIEKWKKEAQ